MLDAGKNIELSVTFYPRNPQVATQSSALVAVNVLRGHPAIEWLGTRTPPPPSPDAREPDEGEWAEMTYGTVLGPSMLNAVCNDVKGTFSYDPPKVIEEEGEGEFLIFYCFKWFNAVFTRLSPSGHAVAVRRVYALHHLHAKLAAELLLRLQTAASRGEAQHSRNQVGHAA